MTKTLEEWSTTLRPVPTMVQGLEDIAKDFRMKLPDRSSLFLFNSIPVQVFREMGALDAVAKKNSRSIASYTRRSLSRPASRGGTFRISHTLPLKLRDRLAWQTS